MSREAGSSGARSGLVIAGGRGRRMGADKALLRIGGERLVDRCHRVLAPLVDDIVLARGDQPTVGLAGVTEVTDPFADPGPLGGLVAGLEAVGHDEVLVLAVDLASPSGEVLDRLARLRGDAHAAVPRVAGRLQPLHAVWSRAALPMLAARLGGEDRSLHAALAALRVRVVERDGWGDLDPVAAFARDIDEPGDLPSGRPDP